MDNMIKHCKEAEEAAIEMTKDDRSDLTKYYRIISYISRVIRYDYVRAITIPKKNGKPDVARTWELKMGICIDISALTVVMLNAVGIDAKMHVGRAGTGKLPKLRHAWVEAVIGDRRLLYDHDAVGTVTYETERIYGVSQKLQGV